MPDGFLNWSSRLHMRIDFPTRWEFGTTLAIMDKESPADLLRGFWEYTLKGEVDGNNGIKMNGNGRVAAG